MLAACALVYLQDANPPPTPFYGPAARELARPFGTLRIGCHPPRIEVSPCTRVPFLLPLTSLSERQARALIEDERICIELPRGGRELFVGCASLTAVLHPVGQRLFLAEDTMFPPRLITSERLPLDAWTERNGERVSVLPELARRDGVAVRAGTRVSIDCGPPAAAEEGLLVTLLTPGACEVGSVFGSPRGGFELPYDVDQVSIVCVRSSEGLPSIELAATLAPPLVEFAAPPIPPAGMTWTLVLNSQLDLEPPSETATPAAAPPPDRGPWFDVAAERGIEFVHFEGPQLQLDIRPTMGPGLAWGDLDGDGWSDLYLAQGSGRAGSRAALDRVFRNERGRRFVDITAASGIRDEGAGMGVTCLDADGDGDLDVYVANYGRDRLYLNDGRAKFNDASDAVGLAGERWHAGVAAADYDQDGDMDVYVTSYLEYAPDKMPPREELAYQRDDPVEMLPFAFPGQPNTLWRNDLEKGALHFTDVAVELGVDDPAGRGMQAVWWDYDGDADLDLYVANDVSPNKLFRNEGGGKFKDVSFSAGVDDPRGSMGLAIDDVDGDLDLDLFVTNWQLEANALYLNNLVNARSAKTHSATFRDAIVQTRMAGASIGFTKWGAEFVDNDRDGDLDLFVANGYTSPDYESTGICVGQRCQYFEQETRLVFRERTDGAAFGEARAHRALAACDYDQDGDLDLALSSNNGPFRLLEWRGESRGHWLGLRLRQPGPNPFAIGAQVRVRAGERTWMRELRAGTSYLAGNPPELHFGLGAAGQVDAIEVRWPDGTRTTHAATAVDQWLSLRRD
jgi:hypothetical protein